MYNYIQFSSNRCSTHRQENSSHITFFGLSFLPLIPIITLSQRVFARTADFSTSKKQSIATEIIIMGNLEDAGISLLLPYYLDDVFAGIFREVGFEVFWADNQEDTEKIIKDNEPDLAIEWRHGDEDFPIRDLLRKHGRQTSVILALNWLRDPPPDDPAEIGFVGYLDVHFPLRELLSLCYKVLPASKRHGLLKMPMVEKGLLFRIK